VYLAHTSALKLATAESEATRFDTQTDTARNKALHIRGKLAARLRRI